MGLFEYGHPFLDGNGRTILLVHLDAFIPSRIFNFMGKYQYSRLPGGPQ
ncbi:hypothetical protein [Polaromonas sp. UBA4122]